jgi:hypothetical protein
MWQVGRFEECLALAELFTQLWWAKPENASRCTSLVASKTLHTTGLGSQYPLQDHDHAKHGDH